MRSFRDAATLLTLVLLVATIRITPIDRMEGLLPTAEAGQQMTEPVRDDRFVIEPDRAEPAAAAQPTRRLRIQRAAETSAADDSRMIYILELEQETERHADHRRCTIERDPRPRSLRTAC